MMMMRRLLRPSIVLAGLLSLLLAQTGASFIVGRQQAQHSSTSGDFAFSTSSTLFAGSEQFNKEDNTSHEEDGSILGTSASVSNEAIVGRRKAVSSLIFLVGASGILSTTSAALAASDAEDDDSFAAIAARAAQINKELEKDAAATAANIRKSEKTAYDFTLPVAQEDVKFEDIIKQEFYPDGVKVKAIVVVNIKQDDIIARKCIPELISLATKFGTRNQADSAIAIVCCPTDQGYFEPDTSALLRLKLASEYGYGINPSTAVTDKVNLLGTGAHPFWRWLESTCRTPQGLGRIEGNFEKFLLDGRTGLPLRRYPRRYAPLNMVDDIEAVIAGRPLPPARANYMEEWRVAAGDAERDTYRFEKGLNWFDQ